MSEVCINDLIDQYQRTFKMLYEEIERFDEKQWKSGFSTFQVPAKQAMHLLDSLDYYFCGRAEDQYTWGHRFGGGWWELSSSQLPDKAAVVAYAREIEARIITELSALQDEDLPKPFPIQDGSGATYLGHCIYALRHTMHHHGQLAALAVHHTGDGGSWA